MRLARSLMSALLDAGRWRGAGRQSGRRRAVAAGVGLALVLGAAVLRASPLWWKLSGGPGKAAPMPLVEAGRLPADANLKVAFIGDTSAKASLHSVLRLIAAERAAFVVHAGDAMYGGEKPADFWGAVDRVLGHGYPYFFAQGNHDRSQWAAFAPHALEHARVPGASLSLTDLVRDPRYHATYRGLGMVFLGEQVQAGDPAYIAERLRSDDHVWKVCVWHKNQRAMQVGGKWNEMGWGVYETCRLAGALVITAHEHSYERTKTLIDIEDQQVDPACPDPRRVCARPGAVPVFVTGLGGESVRGQTRCLPARPPYGCSGEWAFIYTKNQGAKPGALFVVFNVDGDPRKARGTFKNIAGDVVDEFELRVP